MAQVTLPNTIVAGEALDAAKVQENFDALVAAINSIDNTQLAANSVNSAAIVDAVITAAKLADGSVTEDKIAAAAVTTAKVGDGEITDAKLANVVVPLTHVFGDATTISAGTDAPFQSGAGVFDTAKEPLFMVLWRDPVGLAYRTVGSRDSNGAEMPNIHVSGAYNGTDYEVTVFNDTGAAMLFKCVMIGEAA